MDLNEFGEGVIKQLARIANAAEGIEAKLSGGAAKTATGADKPAPAAKPAAEKPAAKPAAEKPAAAKPKHSRDEVNAAIVKLKDDCGKEVAKALIEELGYAKMADIEEKDFDKAFAAAEAKHAAMVSDAEEAGDL